MSILIQRKAFTRLSLLAATALTSGIAHAQAADPVAELSQQVEALRADQQQSAKRIADLEAALARANAQPVPSTAVAAAPPAAPAPSFASAPSRLQINGDVRVRYESNFGDKDARDRDRGVLRARLRANYAINNWLTVGGQLSTGDPDDPNSADITLGNFDDDLQISLDQAWMRATFGNLQIHAGKMPQPFARTELVWDGDVSPQGLSASYRVPLDGGALVKATGLYFLVDESVAGPNSDMIGGQLSIETDPHAPLRAELAVGYYDYSLRSMAGGDVGDFRSNVIVNGRYLSDFDLFDVIGAVTWNGLGERWPIRLTGDYVKNFGAAPGIGDQGFGVDLLAGRIVKPGDWRIGYGYAEAGTDAVLAAFSQDNTNIGTNYLQHTLSVDYVLVPNLILNATYYHYRPKDASQAGLNDPRDWLDRLRLNLLANF
ncbi:hypothetical protein ACFB49_07310 [Sphingomonas sp. DBB INV C78]|uniref:putative porin n=1 Tax=Sphingomonas sp. DBB INV C78 TaxID=3349434 RepID=UPI0036D35E85